MCHKFFKLYFIFSRLDLFYKLGYSRLIFFFIFFFLWKKGIHIFDRWQNIERKFEVSYLLRWRFLMINCFALRFLNFFSGEMLVVNSLYWKMLVVKNSCVSLVCSSFFETIDIELTNKGCIFRMTKIEWKNYWLKLMNVRDINGCTIMMPSNEMGKFCVREHILEMDNEMWDFDLLMSHQKIMINIGK